MTRMRSIILGPPDEGPTVARDIVAIGLLSKPRKRQAAKTKKRRALPAQ